MEFDFSVLYNASFDGYGNCVASKCTNGSQKKVAERCESPQIPLCGLYIIIKKNIITNARVWLPILLFVNLFTRIFILIILHIDNIRTLPEFFHLFIYSRFRNMGKCVCLVSQWGQMNLPFPTMCVYFIYSTLSKNPKQHLTKLHKISRNKRRPNRFVLLCSQRRPLLCCYRFLP